MLRIDFQHIHDSLTQHNETCGLGIFRHSWEMEQVFQLSPSLRSVVPELLDDAFHMGRILAAEAARSMTEFDFPLECCYSVEEVLNRSELDKQ